MPSFWIWLMNRFGPYELWVSPAPYTPVGRTITSGIFALPQTFASTRSPAYFASA